MDLFKKKVLKMSERFTVGIIILCVTGVLLIILGVLVRKLEYREFDPTENGSAKLDVLLLQGPFVKMTEGNETSEVYYIAETSDGNWYVVAEGPNTKLPIYGVDITENDIEKLEAQTIRGKSTKINDKVASYLVDFFRDAGYEITADNYKDYLGEYYLNTTASAGHASMFLFILAAAVVILALSMGMISHKNKKIVLNKLRELEESGHLPVLWEDFSSERSIWSSKFRLAVSDRFVLDFGESKAGFRVFPLQNVNNAFQCNMIDGEPTAMNYIALETAEGDRQYLASCRKTSAEFDKIIARIKDGIDENKESL